MPVLKERSQAGTMRKLHTQAFDWRQAPQSLLHDWQALVADNDLNPSLLPGWVDVVARNWHLEDRLRLLAVFDDARLALVAPYYLESRKTLGIPMRHLTLPGNLVSYHQQFVTHDDDVELFRAFASGVPERWDAIELGEFGSSGESNVTSNAIEALSGGRPGLVMQVPGERSPALRIESTWDSYLATKNKKFRYKLRRRRKDLDALGDVSLRWFDAPDDIPAFMDAILEVERASWKVEAGMAISQREQETTYYRLLLPWLAEQGLLVANVLYIDQKPVAYNACYRFNGKIGQMKTSFVDEYGEYSVGTVSADAVIEKAFNEKATEFDFLGDVMPHKMQWATHVREHTTYFVFANTLRARLIGALKQHRNKRSLRRADNSSP